MPVNLSGYVLSRSRYGRIGLMVATATYIHPGWKGCLTLELFNYGEVPINLYCGSQMAQLVIQDAAPSLDGTPKRLIPTGPEFGRMDADPEWSKFDRFNEQFKT